MHDQPVNPVRIVFVGTVEFSWHCLEEMLSLGANVALAAYLDPANAKGVSDYRPLDDLCEAHGVPALTFRRIGDPATVAAIRAAEPEIIFVLGLSQLLPADLLALPPAGAIGSHPALLPHNRGRALIPWSILLHHERGGLTLFYLTPEVDAGDVIAQVSWPITREDTATSLYRKMIAAGRRLVRERLPAITAGTAPRTPQDHSKATYLPRRTPEDGRIDWTQPAEKVYDLIRASTHPYPGAFTYLQPGTGCLQPVSDPRTGWPATGATQRKLICWSARLDERAQGQPGVVLAIGGSSVLVAACRGGVWLDLVDLGTGECTPVSAGLKPGARLGPTE